MKQLQYNCLLMVLLCLGVAVACKNDQKVADETTKETIDSILHNIDGIDSNLDTTSKASKSLIPEPVKKKRDSILREQIAASKMVEMSCEEILEKYEQAMEAASKGDMTKLSKIDPNDPIYNKCRNSEPHKSKFEAIDLKYAEN